MHRNIAVLKEWLRLKYAELGIAIGHSDQPSTVSWLEISEHCVELKDPEIGVWMRFSVLCHKEQSSSIFQQDLRWALDSVSKLDYRSGVSASTSDELGAWQVHVVWIVDEQCKPAWTHDMRELRNRSAHAEEVGADLIDLTQKDMQHALLDDGVPALMFKTRSLIRMSAAEMPKWISPDHEFEDRLRNLTNSIFDKEQKDFTSAFLARALAVGVGENASQPVLNSDLGTLKINNVRNIVQAELPLQQTDTALIIHGPNGTGKSSLFESVCLALFGTSKRHYEFIMDRDVLPTARANYVGQVLSRFGSDPQHSPSISMGGVEVLASLDSGAENARERLVAGRGTVLAQEAAREFLAMTSSELASFVLGDYSPRARQVQAEVDAGAQTAKSEWQEWLRSYGLNTSITKAETILRKLVSRVVQDECPPEAQAPLLWLQNVGERFPELSELSKACRSRWDELDSVASREMLVGQVASAVEKSGSGERPLSNWLTERAMASLEVSKFIGVAADAIDHVRANWISTKEDVLAWSSWLQSPPSISASEIAPSVDQALATRESSIRVRLAELAPLGQELRGRKDHLRGLQDSFLKLWKKDHPHTCPTCETQHPEEIDAIVEANIQAVEKAYMAVRTEYAALQAEEKQLRSESKTEQSVCPISSERQVELASLLGLPVGGPASLEAIISSDKGQVDKLVSSFERVFVIPQWKSPQNEESIEALAKDMATRILQVRAEGIERQDLPVRWESLKKSIDSTALDVVSNHLPKTIGALWREISLVLAPANWIQSRQPQMSMELKRGSERLGVVVRRNSDYPEIPARHVLNQAEQHVLGLAWFFTRHLSHGRFIVPFIALDDPAQEMDQVTYRKFVRFMQAFQRAHRSLAKPLGILVLLHQEERALDIARATSKDGALMVLGWAQEVRSSGPDSTVRTVQLRNSEQLAPSAVRVSGAQQVVV